MTRNKMIAVAVAGVVALVVLIAVVRVVSRDSVTQKYDAMAIAIEDHCKSNLIDKEKCSTFAKCYRGGIEAAWPRDLMRKMIESNMQEGMPPEVNQAVINLEKTCGQTIGVAVQ